MAGPGSLLAWALCAISFGCVLACLIWLSRRYAETGAFYTLFTKAFGEKTSGAIVICYIVSGILGVATIAAAIGDNVSIGLPGRTVPLSLLYVFVIVTAIYISLNFA